uniref:Uncharacterized protein n=1 Tax=Rhizophora mucronata TaxID=61149 RepID=A0A2P2QFR2_RHIMU
MDCNQWNCTALFVIIMVYSDRFDKRSD